LQDPEYIAWRAEAFKHGYASLASFPLTADGSAFGALNIYASEWNAFDDEEVHLLTELADDLAYGVTSLRTQDELRRNEANYRAIFDAANDAIFVHDTETGAILDVNPKMTEMYGYTPEEARQINVEDISSGEPPYAQDDALQWIGKAVEGEPQIFEWRSKDKAGRTFWVEVNLKRAVLADEDRLLAIIRDVTQRKRAEEDLERYAEDLARSNAELQEFAYVASHDLQEPLRMVGSYVQLLAKRYQGRLDPDADEFIGFAVEGVERMERLINDLLEYSRVGTRGKPFEPTDSEAVLAESLENLKTGIQESRAEVTHDPLPTVNVDPLQLEQVLRNLIGNAMKFRREDEPPRIHVSAEKSDHEWVFSVRDNGIGIAPEHVGRLFQIFERLHPAGRYPGTGMGLAICKKIVERHGGRIWVESELGTGSTFYFTIPE
jgi:PAS domain S-box-containing protein